MSCLISFETSGWDCSVSFLKEDEGIFGATFFLDQSQAKVLAILTEKILKVSKISLTNLNAVAIGAGPGSYTGLRIGTSFAKGICFGANLPLIGISTMENIANQVFEKYDDAEFAFVALDARRSEIYAAILNRKLEFSFPTKAVILGEFDFAGFLEGKEVVVAGNGAQKTIDHYHKPLNWVADQAISPNSKTVAKLGMSKLRSQKFENLAEFEPDYIKPVYITTRP